MIGPRELDDIPYFAGRGATPADVEAGKATFAQDPPGSPYEMKLPARARHQNDDGSFEEVIIVQAENHSMSDDVVVGYKTTDGGAGVGLLWEMQLL